MRFFLVNIIMYIAMFTINAEIMRNIADPVCTKDGEIFKVNQAPERTEELITTFQNLDENIFLGGRLVNLAQTSFIDLGGALFNKDGLKNQQDDGRFVNLWATRSIDKKQKSIIGAVAGGVFLDLIFPEDITPEEQQRKITPLYNVAGKNEELRRTININTNTLVSNTRKMFKRDDLEQVQRFGRRNLESVLQNIDEQKNVSLSEFMENPSIFGDDEGVFIKFNNALKIFYQLGSVTEGVVPPSIVQSILKVEDEEMRANQRVAYNKLGDLIQQLIELQPSIQNNTISEMVIDNSKSSLVPVQKISEIISALDIDPNTAFENLTFSQRKKVVTNMQFQAMAYHQTQNNEIYQQEVSSSARIVQLYSEIENLILKAPISDDGKREWLNRASVLNGTSNLGTFIIQTTFNTTIESLWNLISGTFGSSGETVSINPNSIPISSSQHQAILDSYMRYAFTYTFNLQLLLSPILLFGFLISRKISYMFIKKAEEKGKSSLASKPGVVMELVRTLGSMTYRIASNPMSWAVSFAYFMRSADTVSVIDEVKSYFDEKLNGLSSRLDTIIVQIQQELEQNRSIPRSVVVDRNIVEGLDNAVTHYELKQIIDVNTAAVSADFRDFMFVLIVEVAELLLRKSLFVFEFAGQVGLGHNQFFLKLPKGPPVHTLGPDLAFGQCVVVAVAGDKIGDFGVHRFIEQVVDVFRCGFAGFLIEQDIGDLTADGFADVGPGLFLKGGFGHFWGGRLEDIFGDRQNFIGGDRFGLDTQGHAGAGGGGQFAHPDGQADLLHLLFGVFAVFFLAAAADAKQRNRQAGNTQDCHIFYFYSHTSPIKSCSWFLIVPNYTPIV